MSPRTESACPSCWGHRLAHHPAGLVIAHYPSCPVLADEDATAHADAEALRRHGGATFRRYSTAAERTLLAELGHVLPTGALTTVASLTGSVRHRSWTGVDLDAPPVPAP